jgi:hypothetical protein
MSVLAWLGLGRRRLPEDDSDAIQRIVAELEALDPAAARHMALFAFLLSRGANVDQDITSEETREMERDRPCPTRARGEPARSFSVRPWAGVMKGR